MPETWDAIGELHGSADHPDDAVEAAEAYKNRFDGDEYRIVVVEAETGTDAGYRVHLEKQFGEAPGWTEIGTKYGDCEIEMLISAVENMNNDGDNVRVVYDYTNDESRLEAFISE